MPTSEHTVPADFLNELQVLFDSGEHAKALERLNTYLSEHPKATEAQLLKATWCLQLKQDAPYILEVAYQKKIASLYAAKHAALLHDIEQQVRYCLEQGRQVVNNDLEAGIQLLRFAVNLSTSEPSVALAAALGLHHFPPSRLTRSPFGSPSKESVKMLHDNIIYFYEVALQNSPPDTTVYSRAAVELGKYLLKENGLQRAVELFHDLETTDPAVQEILTNVAQDALIELLTIAGLLSGTGQLVEARRLLNELIKLAPVPPTYLLLAFTAPTPTEALYSYSTIVQRERGTAAGNDKQDNHTTLPTLRNLYPLWKKAHLIPIVCPHCTRDNTPTLNDACRFCSLSLVTHESILTQYDLGQADMLTVAYIGMAQEHLKLNEIAQAVHYWQQALSLLKPSHKAYGMLAALYQQYAAKLPAAKPVETADASVIEQVLALLDIPQTAQQMKMTLENLLASETAAWHHVPVQTRARLIRKLIKDEHLSLAQQTIKLAFADNPHRKTVQQLHQQLNIAILKYAEALLVLARQALSEDKPELAIDFAEQALKLAPDLGMARLARASARLRTGRELAALDDYRTVIAQSNRHDEIHAARLGAALALETRHSYDEALAVLGDATDFASIRARLERRKVGEPAIVIRSAETSLMVDTLTHTQGRVYHACFAISLRAVGRPFHYSIEQWASQLAGEWYEFVRILGSTNNRAGDPTFTVRIISYPNAEVQERGRLQIALICRVSAPTNMEADSLAKRLWADLGNILPGVQHYAYIFEAVTDENELYDLLKPFKPEQIAMFAHREEMRGPQYAVQPFVIGSLDLHSVCWALLRQPVPAMLSVQIMPTNLMQWEQAQINRQMSGDKNSLADAQQQANSEIVNGTDTPAQWWNYVQGLGIAVTNRNLLDTMQTQAYLMQIYVAGAHNSSPMLADIVGAALFSPTRRIDGSLRGNYEVIQPYNTREMGQAFANLYTLDISPWGYTAAPEGLQRLRYLSNDMETASFFRLPLPLSQGVPGLSMIDAKPVAPPPGLPINGIVLGESLTHVNGHALRVTQSIDDRRRHTYVVGKTGVGKSTLLKNLALQDIQAGYGVCVIDPHGDLVEDILLHIPSHRVQDVIIFDPSDEERPIGLNLLESYSEAERHRIVTEFIGLLVRMYDPHQQGIAGPRFQHNVRNAMLTVMSVEGNTLIEVVRALTDMDFVRQILPHVTDPLVRNYWEKQIANTSDYHRSEVLDYFVSKFSRFVGDQLVRNIIGQRKTTLDFRKIMDERRILLVNLSKGKIGPESSQFLGLLVVQRLLLTALSRADTMAMDRSDFFLYVDEFQNFATELFSTMLSEGRKYGLAVTVANQYLTQLDASTREAIFGNVGSLVAFRLGIQDAVYLAPEMYPSFDADDLINLPRYTTSVKLLVEGIAARPFSMRTILDTRTPDRGRAAQLRQQSRERYGRDVQAVTQEIQRRFKPDDDDND